jgi:hypothetical protein
MSKQIEAMKLALERLQSRTDTADLDAIAALNEALASEAKEQPRGEATLAQLLTLWNEAQHERAYRNSPELHKDVTSLAAFKRVAKEIAAMYGITSGEATKKGNT